jgi:hypothetical protein
LTIKIFGSWLKRHAFLVALDSLRLVARADYSLPYLKQQHGRICFEADAVDEDSCNGEPTRELVKTKSTAPKI